MQNHWLIQIEKNKGKNMKFYTEIIREKYGKDLSWIEVQALDRQEHLAILCKLEEAIKLDQSPYDIEKLSRAIQYSRSGMGGSAMTPYTCHFCGKQDIWTNTAIPNICKDCTDEMAKAIILSGFDLSKSQKGITNETTFTS